MTAGARVGRPAPARLVAAYLASALLCWLGAAIAIARAAPELASAGIAAPDVLFAVHLVGLGFLPLAVTGAALHVLPTLLRNDASRSRGWMALPLLGAGPLLAYAIAYDREALTWIAAADVLLSASRSEGAPSVVREARALGVPVAAARVGDLPAWAQADAGLFLID